MEYHRVGCLPFSAWAVVGRVPYGWVFRAFGEQPMKGLLPSFPFPHIFPPPCTSAATPICPGTNSPPFFYLNTVDVLNLMILLLWPTACILGWWTEFLASTQEVPGEPPLQSDNLQYLHCQVPPGGQDCPQLRTTAIVPTLNPGPGKRQFLKTEKTDPDLVLILGESSFFLHL